ncbi:3-oxoacyl-(acyl-carrier-protein) synthase II [Nostocoides australiense Ben110]|uniref:3-oxoacyl-[acyl-carrier-protein] synthase 2 n=1 Tax=Nostocoides australiense Ben110 TaxID=1193182 RepID=W6JWW6_9MICO|nr:beta-ketoacyl-[acyl-carrier-protein] synthase family protein [Tetrasphaera australiensis]CCH73602.1 3-oxoacyl-(acyl-carrier-protein) synthase II [Tetrasphaera australiensis Ben110]
MTGIAITGVGPVTPIGVGSVEFQEAWVAGRSGIAQITRFDASDLAVTIAGEVDIDPTDWLSRRDLATVDRFTVLAFAAASLAIEDSGFLRSGQDTDRVGVFLATGGAGLSTWEETTETLWTKGPQHIGPRVIPKSMANNAAAFMSMKFGLRGPSVTTVSACASGSDAIVAAAHSLGAGECDVAVVGGAEAPVTPATVSGFAQMRALSRRNDSPVQACRPFDVDRDGFVIGEGAGVMVLEREDIAAARGARVYARLIGHGRASDAYHVTAPHPEGGGAALAMRRALASANLQPTDVDYVNAHGTGTVLNDSSEAQALHQVFGAGGARVTVSSTKGHTGHLIGAAGAVEAIVCAQVFDVDLLPSTANLTHPDPAFNLDLVALHARPAHPQTVMSTSNAFGGHNVAVLLGRPEVA